MLSEQDKHRLQKAFKLWPQRLAPYGHPQPEPAFTHRMEELGFQVRMSIENGIFQVSELRKFLLEVGYWKMPRQRASHEANVAKNSDASLEATFRALVQDREDRKRITICTGLNGFGKETRQTRMASAILRFLWPELYGVIDWRNWAVLSNCEHQFLSNPFLPQLASTCRELRQALYDVPSFLEYTAILRGLGLEIGLDRSADVDLALYSYSAEVWPFPRLRDSLEAALEARTAREKHTLPLHEIYETYWNEWEQLGNLPPEEQRVMKVKFLELCLKVTPQNVQVWDEATAQRIPYHKKHLRDLEQVKSKIAHWPAQRAIGELDAFMWFMRLKGEGLGVL